MTTDTLELPTLALQRVGKTYQVDGRTVSALEGVSLQVGPGEILAIVGASGCGKSTLLRLVAGLDDDFTGQVLIEGVPVDGPRGERALVFQDHRLFPWLNVSDNVALGLDNVSIAPAERQRRVQDMLALVGLSGFSRAWPHQLSGGMAQRVSIARALVGKPAILLMDEPFGALDSLTRAHMQEELLRIQSERRVTIVIVTHDVEEALFLADTVVIMRPRPGTVRSTLSVDLPRPRDRASLGFAGLRQRVLEQLR